MKATIEKVGAAYGITEYKVSNGLRVLHKRDKTLPIAAVCVTYHVGSRNEAPGHTGATHILEHLMFKDSKGFNKENGREMAVYLEWKGALWNATTSLDRTNYYELIQAKDLPIALEMEADRMRNALFDDADLASEMTVVRNEYERGRNNPYVLLNESVAAQAFDLHPYRIPTIGSKEDIESSTAAKLREFYDRFYWPNNATIAIFGDVEAATVEKLVPKYFGAIPQSPQAIATMEVVEPEQSGARSVSIEKAAGVSIVELSYKAPAAHDPDWLPLYAFGIIVSGGFSSVLQKQIVDKGIAADISFYSFPTFDPYLMSFIASVGKNETPERVLALMRSTLEKTVKKGVSAAELKRAAERMQSQSAGERDGMFNEVNFVSDAIAIGNWKFGYEIEDRLPKLTAKEVNAAARRFISVKNENAGILHDAI